jgi:hypothetical protein
MRLWLPSIKHAESACRPPVAGRGRLDADAREPHNEIRAPINEQRSGSLIALRETVNADENQDTTS